VVARLGLVPFTFRYVRNGRRLLFEEDSSDGTLRLSLVQANGDFTPREVEEAYAEALDRWLHPLDSQGDTPG
jgi:hypothetical protein